MSQIRETLQYEVVSRPMYRWVMSHGRGLRISKYVEPHRLSPDYPLMSDMSARDAVEVMNPNAIPPMDWRRVDHPSVIRRPLKRRAPGSRRWIGEM